MSFWTGLRLDQLGVSQPGPQRRPRDWVLFGILTGIAVIEAVTLSVVRDFTEDSDIVETSALSLSFWTLIPALAAISFLLFRRQLPLQVAFAATAGRAVFIVIAIWTDTSASSLLSGAVARLILIYAVCRWTTVRTVMFSLPLLGALALLPQLYDNQTGIADDLSFLAPWAAAGSLAAAMRYRARLAEQQKAQVRLGERHALARELHDTVAHHVSAIAVQAQAAQFVVANDPHAALESMKAVEDIANTTIDEMRRMVGILRSDDDRARAVTPTTLQELAAPNARPRILVIGETDLTDLTPPIAAAVYRIVQESITNARRHCRDVTFVDVSVSITEAAVDVAIANDGTPTTRNSGTGYGLVGMQERVEALDGALSAGPRPANGWAVHAHIPRQRRREAQLT